MGRWTVAAGYVNAVEVADRHSMRVVLGTAIGPSALRSTEHAWVVDDAGTPWEVTWSTPGTDDRGCPLDSIPPRQEVLTLANVALSRTRSSRPGSMTPSPPQRQSDQ